MIQLHSRVFAVNVASLMCLASAFSASAQSDYYMTMPDVQANGGNTVTVPVGYVLNHDHDNLCLTCADRNGDGNIIIGDVTALISRVLAGN